VLYVLNLGGSDETRILARMDTGVGMDEDPTGAGRTNGLAEVSTLDENSDLIADRAYAGDHFGNLWRFDLTDTNKPPTRLFRARDPYGAPQPITSRIAFTRHPNGGYMLFFGTGRWINADDKLDDSVQTFYGIWDDDGLVHPGPGGDFSEPTRADLIWHEFLFVNNPIKVEGRDDDGLGTGVIVSEGRISSTDAAPKSTPAGAIRGWMIDLVTKDEDDDLIYAGERVVVAPQVRQGRVVFVSMIPGDCCSAGGSSWINALDALDGSRLDFTPFDFNMDGKFDTHDLLDVDGDPTTQGVVGSSIRVYNPNETGIYSAPSTLDMGGGEVMSIVSDSEGDLIQLEEWGAFGWRTWLQLQ
jgi:type IV pilus assembly protein PilY1